MGHERISVLPKTKRWRTVVDNIFHFDRTNSDITDITKQTLKNVRKSYNSIYEDDGVIASFQFLVSLSLSSKLNQVDIELNEKKIQISNKNTTGEVAILLNDWINQNKNSQEYSQIAQRAATDAIVQWYKQNNNNQSDLFSENIQPEHIWSKASKGDGFCELSRLYFSNFTARYLNYFLEREASSRTTSIYDRDLLNIKVKEHLNDISKHAFETAFITQSFSAGWFNKLLKNGELPSKLKVKNFLKIAFGKLQDELEHEVVK